jgi:hypothetical protein
VVTCTALVPVVTYGRGGWNKSVRLNDVATGENAPLGWHADWLLRLTFGPAGVAARVRLPQAIRRTVLALLGSA